MIVLVRKAADCCEEDAAGGEEGGSPVGEKKDGELSVRGLEKRRGRGDDRGWPRLHRRTETPSCLPLFVCVGK